jgi:hypothetical protein
MTLFEERRMSMSEKEIRCSTILTESEFRAVKHEADEQGRSLRRQIQHIVKKWKERMDLDKQMEV